MHEGCYYFASSFLTFVFIFFPLRVLGRPQKPYFLGLNHGSEIMSKTGDVSPEPQLSLKWRCNTFHTDLPGGLKDLTVC